MTLLKSIVASLVLANVGYYLWAREIAPAPEARQPAAPAGTLKLASEVAVAGRAVGVDAGGGIASGNGGASGGNGVGAGGALGNGGATAAGGAAINSGESGTGGMGGAGSAAAANAGSVGAGGGSVLDGAGNMSGGADASADAASTGLLTNVKRCISVGPFRDVSEAARAASTLRAGHYDPRQRVAEGEVWAGVWVYLPIPAARGAGDQMLTKLKAGGIDDALEMPGPTEGSVISLGLFSEPKRAQARVTQAQALGFNPGISDRKRTGNVYWIDIDLKPTDGLLNPADLQNEAGRIVRLEVKGCPSVSGAAT